MIPKIIHYCWFGGNPMPKDEAAYIEGWKKILKDYEFKLWNEENFDIHATLFTERAAKAKKWAFIADFARFYAVYNYGGVYLDTDVEVIKPFDKLLGANICFSGFEDEEYVAPGLIFAGEKGCAIAKEVMDFYSNFRFVDNKWPLDMITVPVVLTNLLLKYGLQRNNTYQNLKCITIYPTEYFCPKSFMTGIVSTTCNTYSIHHYKASWVSDCGKEKINERWDIFNKYGDNELSNKLAELTEKDITSIPIGYACKIILKRIVKKMLGEKLVNFLKKRKQPNTRYEAN
jgi:mannosyltransferase OCH1-like enzyme